MYIQRFILLLCVYICTYVQEFFKRMEEKTGLIPTRLDSIWTIQDIVLVEVHIYYGCVSSEIRMLLITGNTKILNNSPE